ncbi:hypothetical protein NFJ02_18g31540 [Pycnococcus provasolii]
MRSPSSCTAPGCSAYLPQAARMLLQLIVNALLHGVGVDGIVGRVDAVRLEACVFQEFRSLRDERERGLPPQPLTSALRWRAGGIETLAHTPPRAIHESKCCGELFRFAVLLRVPGVEVRLARLLDAPLPP